ncbi:DUF4932 domain-containing protein [Mucilaginibacter calamicampi]|uniref:DUF4932 domain-containing protein n=1 Tax=Mucilaginibacter calamicampi TaxID=1302352 RepID=A0ABW2YS05_9SPHI
MKRLTLIILLWSAQHSFAQHTVQLSKKVSVAINTNLETYFFAEKLAVEHMNDFVFDHKGWDYAHQPIVHYAFLRFKPYINTPVIVRIAALLREVKNAYQDNSPVMNYLLNQKEFPAEGPLYKELPIDPAHPFIKAILAELTDSLRSFYQMAKVGAFIQENTFFYQGALREVEKDIDAASFPALEKWYGKTFPAYQIYLAPGMPIPKGEDNYRAFAPSIMSAKGVIPAMVMSSDQMLPLEASLSSYKGFGFDNPGVTHFLTRHEMGHSFVNPLIEAYTAQLRSDSVLFTPELREILAPHYIHDWYVCVIEHMVRLGEIRTAISMTNLQEAERLRRMHIYDEKCVLIPLLENEIKKYDENRRRYPSFESYLPVLIAYLNSLTPAVINDQIERYGKK